MIAEQQVHPKDIESQLVKVWDTLQGKNKMRACLFNLIIYARNDASRPYLQSVAQRVVKKFPCRVIFVTADPLSSENTMKSFVSVIGAEGEGSAIFCDQIQIELSGKDCEKAHFLILPHILPDLPLYLVWGEDPSKSSETLFKLESYASKTIFDSSSASSLTEFAKSALLHHEKTSSAIIDLAFARTEGWRNLITSHFYCKERVDFIQNAQSLTLTYNAIATTPIQAIYLASWIASSLGWRFVKKEGFKLTYHTGKKEIIIDLKSSLLERVKPGRVLSLEIDSGKAEVFHFTREAKDPYVIQIRHTLPTYCESPSQYLLEKEESGQSLTSEIFHTGTSHHFLNALKLILDMGAI